MVQTVNRRSAEGPPCGGLMDSQRTCPVDGHVGGDGAGQLVGRHSVERTSDPAHAGFSPGLRGCRVSAVENSSTALEEAPARGRER